MLHTSRCEKRTLLEKMRSELADRYKHLRDELNSPGIGLYRYSDSQRALQSDNARRYNISREFEDTIMPIRHQSDFDKFPPGPSTEDLKQFASNKLIVLVNASHNNSHALLITLVAVQCVILENLEYNDVEIYSMYMNTLLVLPLSIIPYIRPVV